MRKLMLSLARFRSAFRVMSAYRNVATVVMGPMGVSGRDTAPHEDHNVTSSTSAPPSSSIEQTINNLYGYMQSMNARQHGGKHKTKLEFEKQISFFLQKPKERFPYSSLIQKSPSPDFLSGRSDSLFQSLQFAFFATQLLNFRCSPNASVSFKARVSTSKRKLGFIYWILEVRCFEVLRAAISVN
ncbi:Uncharacterized protein TCM_023400 [Theobroma cacao]|uniref:Uncharacterized protein n=1 Tax=Theobroma cacao TaxID=3641 RepID=A0A061EVC8_THECC|nr:Uncharacterized protein TCM_023400 [Theobroma cacao]